MNKRKLCVSTGHIHWDPEFSDVKLIQTLFWSSELWNYIRDYFKAENMPYLSPSEVTPVLGGLVLMMGFGADAGDPLR